MLSTSDPLYQVKEVNNILQVSASRDENYCTIAADIDLVDERTAPGGKSIVCSTAERAMN